MKLGTRCGLSMVCFCSSRHGHPQRELTALAYIFMGEIMANSLASLSGLVGAPSAKIEQVTVCRYENGWGVQTCRKLFVYVTLKEALTKVEDLFNQE